MRHMPGLNPDIIWLRTNVSQRLFPTCECICFRNFEINVQEFIDLKWNQTALERELPNMSIYRILIPRTVYKPKLTMCRQPQFGSIFNASV